MKSRSSHRATSHADTDTLGEHVQRRGAAHGQASGEHGTESLQTSERMILQHQSVHAAFGSAAQLQARLDGVPAPGEFDAVAQRAVTQFGGDMHYWVVNSDTGDRQYVNSFKGHSAANDWWAANKGNWVGYTFGQGSSKTKYR